MIHEGKLVLSEPKDELLTPSTDGLFVGVKRSGYGFEALARDRAAVRRALSDKVILEKPTVEDIMLFYTRKGA